MNLYIIRHARAEPRDASRWPDDSLRPLTAEGVRRFEPVADGLRRFADPPDVLLSSGWTRAWQTAEILTERAHWPRPQRCEALEDGRSDAMLQAVRDAAHGGRDVALVGHEPDLSSFLACMLTGRVEGMAVMMKKGGTALLTTGDPPTAGGAALQWLLPPRILRRER